MPEDDQNRHVAWVLTDGRAGNLSQALGLAESVGFDVVIKTINPSAPWKWLPAGLWPAGVAGTGEGGESLAGAAPDLVVSCGRRAIGPAVWLKRRHGDRLFLAHILDPRGQLARFDMVVAPAHDGIDAPNVVEMDGSLHGITQTKIKEAAARFRNARGDLPRPLVAVLIGGNNRTYRFTEEAVDRLVRDLRALSDRHGARLLVTMSRRTGADAARKLRDGLKDVAADIWDGGGDNPYLAYLGLADAIVVTGDSVNMISEACSTGKPVYIFPLAGGENSKFAKFHEAMVSKGHARYFSGDLEPWSGVPLDETSRVAKEVRKRMGLSA